MKVCNFIKKVTPTQVFSCQYYEIFKNSFFYWTLPVAATETGDKENCYERPLRSMDLSTDLLFYLHLRF